MWLEALHLLIQSKLNHLRSTRRTALVFFLWQLHTRCLSPADKPGEHSHTHLDLYSGIVRTQPTGWASVHAAVQELPRRVSTRRRAPRTGRPPLLRRTRSMSAPLQARPQVSGLQRLATRSARAPLPGQGRLYNPAPLLGRTRQLWPAQGVRSPWGPTVRHSACSMCRCWPAPASLVLCRVLKHFVPWLNSRLEHA